MSATNALTKSVNQTATPELRTSTILGSSRREEALISFLRVHILQTPPNLISPFSFSAGFSDFCICYLVISPLKCSLKNLKHFSLNLKCLALYQVLTKNLSE